ncbi:glycosyltransferase family 39 protein [Actinopolymorpha sp. NPDC004070]|uniref:glycosyltransferase family 39 protein n=1 Tax=Actinopolymorpha sp. NPDC004070 TaxID=3154548 RepID=UPI0033A464C2
MTIDQVRARPVTAAPTREPFATLPVLLVAAVVAALLVATSNRYGYHRDELYFRLLGQHPAWGYVDQPPATPLLAGLTRALFGDHLWALRLPSALAVAGAAILTALLVREWGGGRAAQVLGALGVVAVFPLAGGHVLATATLDLVLQAAVLLCVARALLRDPRWWLAAGAVVGAGLYVKYLVVLTLLAVGVGLLLAGPRRVLASRWLWAGVLLALVVGAPNLVYQATHHWPQLTMAGAIERNKGAGSRVSFLPLQLVMLGLFMVPVWVAGLVRLLREPGLRPVRAMAVAYPAACVLVLVLGGQPYYTLGLILALYAAGCAPVVRWMARGQRVGRVGRIGRVAAFTTALVLNVAMSVLVALPLLPVRVLAATHLADANQVVADQIGWPEYVRQIADVYRGLPAADASRAVIVTANYGEAGALDRFGTGLPPVHSAHNALWFLGRPAEDRTVVILVGFADAGPRLAWFGSCRVAARLDNGVGIPNEEQSNDVKVCHDPVRPWSQLWPDLRHYD